MAIECPPEKSKQDYLNLSEDEKNALTDNDAYDYMYDGTLGDHLQWPHIRAASNTTREAIERLLWIKRNNMTDSSINKSVKKWMIISWAHIDSLDDAYGRLCEIVEGTHEEAIESAKKWVLWGNGSCKPIGIVEAING